MPSCGGVPPERSLSTPAAAAASGVAVAAATLAALPVRADLVGVENILTWHRPYPDAGACTEGERLLTLAQANERAGAQSQQTPRWLAKVGCQTCVCVYSEFTCTSSSNLKSGAPEKSREESSSCSHTWPCHK